MHKVLLAEVAPVVDGSLRAHGFATTVVGDGGAALTLARSDVFDLLILDVDIHGTDAFEVLDEVRRSDPGLPVILTGGNRVADLVAGFEAGADDYVAKPFDVAELAARIRARLRQGRAEVTVLEGGGVALDLRTHCAAVAGREVELTPRESALAAELLRNVGRPLTRAQLLLRVWGYRHDPTSNIVDVYVGYLRKKLRPVSIAAVRGIGYRLEAVAG